MRGGWVHAGATAPLNSPTPPIEFFTIQLMPLSEGGISASLRSTTFDETDFALLDQDIANVRIRAAVDPSNRHSLRHTARPPFARRSAMGALDRPKKT